MLIDESELIERIGAGSITEIDVTNLELKRTWEQDYGKKISAFANRPSGEVHWMCIGVSDDGSLAGYDESWAKKTEESISQHINKCLDPQITCVGVSCHEIQGQWFIAIKFANPGSVVYWNGAAYKGSGTTIQVMTPEEVMNLTVGLPGLIDYSAQKSDEYFQEEFIIDFVGVLTTRRPNMLLGSLTAILPEDVLKRIGIYGTNTQRILFGKLGYRVVKYDAKGAPIENETFTGLYGLLRPRFLAAVQEWTRQQQGLHSDPYPMDALKEAFANAVAHAAYFDSDGDIILELYPDRLCISNLCVHESLYFANKWFSRSHKTVNKILMESLRLAGFVDELGRGKNLIFSLSLQSGQRPPEVVVEKGNRYDRWRLYIYAGQQNRQYLRILERLREMYIDEHKALIAHALVLWSSQSVSTIKQYVDGESAKLFADVLSDVNGPIFYYQKNDSIVLRRWVRVLVGEGKDSKQLSSAEEEELYEFSYKMQTGYHKGYITPKELRDYAGLGHTNSEIVQSSQLMKRWMDQGKIKRIRKGVYKFIEKAPSIDWKQLMKELSTQLPQGLPPNP
jgi:hypothetical protein